MIGAICGPIAGPIVAPAVGGDPAVTGGGFTPSSLFAAGEVGAWYDPSDLSTLFQDHICTTPVTAVDQSVAFMLDKSRGLVRGAELVSNGDFASGLTGWTAIGTGGSSTVVAGELEITGGGGSSPGRRKSITTVVGTLYEITVTGRQGTTVQTVSAGFGASALTFTTAATKTMKVIATATTTNLDLVIANGAASGTAYFDNISVKALPGLHVGQTTAAARPLLKQDANGRYLLRFDGTDDGIFTPYLTAGQTFPFTMVCAAKANADALGGAFGVWGGAPPYYEIQKSVTADQWRAFDRGAVNYTNVEVGATASAHVLTMEMATTTVNLRVDGTDPTAATTQDNLIGTITDIRIGNGGGGFFNGDFYGGVARFGTLTAMQRTSLERFLGNKAGAAVA